jgi:hypothetical protein
MYSLCRGSKEYCLVMIKVSKDFVELYYELDRMCAPVTYEETHKSKILP